MLTKSKSKIERAKKFFLLLITQYLLLNLTLVTNCFSQETWTETETINAPPGRQDHSAVWTGTKMIVWGGYIEFINISGGLQDGGIYNPLMNSWTATSTTNAPSARDGHIAVWTGTKMIIWGGYNGSYFNTGGIYDPVTDSWTATSTTNAPIGRSGHRAVWTGTKMIIWGGYNGTYLNTGGIYDPATDTWMAVSMTNAPTVRTLPSIVWTGTKMIVWGGYGANTYWNTGGIYDPLTDTWTTTSTVNAPAGRVIHTAVWTGTKMIIWGGKGSSYFNTGGVYDPLTDIWTTMSTANAPIARNSHTAIWTGIRMIVWGGETSGYPNFAYTNTGGIYDPLTDTWIATSLTGVPVARYKHTMVWTETEMIVWGGWAGYAVGFPITGGVYYNPSIIPVELTSFVGSSINGRVELSWTTATELNNSGFEIQRSADRINFSNIAFVPGFGTTTEQKSYSYTDNSVNNGTYYYRLKQVDYNGAFAYSDIVEVDVAASIEFALDQNYPNPFNPSSIIGYRLSMNSMVTLKVYDLIGREVVTLVNEEKQAGSYEVEFNPSALSLPSGVYFYQLQAGEFIETKQMLLLK